VKEALRGAATRQGAVRGSVPRASSGPRSKRLGRGLGDHDGVFRIHRGLATRALMETVRERFRMCFGGSSGLLRGTEGLPVGVLEGTAQRPLRGPFRGTLRPWRAPRSRPCSAASGTHFARNRPSDRTTGRPRRGAAPYRGPQGTRPVRRALKDPARIRCKAYDVEKEAGDSLASAKRACQGPGQGWSPARPYGIPYGTNPDGLHRFGSPNRCGCESRRRRFTMCPNAIPAMTTPADFVEMQRSETPRLPEGR